MVKDLKDDKLIKNYSEKIKIAREAVVGEDEPYKTESFKIILEHLLNLETVEEYPVPSSTSRSPEKKSARSNKPNIQNKKSELATNCGITIVELNDVFSINDKDQLEMLVPIEGMEAEQQIIASQCLLAAYEVLYGYDWVDSPLLVESLRSMGIKDKGRNLSTNLKKKSDIFRLMGKAPHKKYKLTNPARKSAFNLIKKLAKGEKLYED